MAVWKQEKTVIQQTADVLNSSATAAESFKRSIAATRDELIKKFMPSQSHMANRSPRYRERMKAIAEKKAENYQKYGTTTGRDNPQTQWEFQKQDQTDEQGRLNDSRKAAAADVDYITKGADKGRNSGPSPKTVKAAQNTEKKTGNSVKALTKTFNELSKHADEQNKISTTLTDQIIESVEVMVGINDRLVNVESTLSSLLGA